MSYRKIRRILNHNLATLVIFDLASVTAARIQGDSIEVVYGHSPKWVELVSINHYDMLTQAFAWLDEALYALQHTMPVIEDCVLDAPEYEDA